MDSSTQTLELEEVSERVDEFFRKYYQEELLRIARIYPDEKRLIVNFKDLEIFDFALSEHLLSFPDETLSASERVIRSLDLPFEGTTPE
ncbi:MAG TPA: hypothetical protein ENH51_01135, partial [Euryarchaeota archaeon]|nr:hypothetical protein [Euryarchaeota archaeon]